MWYDTCHIKRTLLADTWLRNVVFFFQKSDLQAYISLHNFVVDTVFFDFIGRFERVDLKESEPSSLWLFNNGYLKLHIHIHITQ